MAEPSATSRAEELRKELNYHNHRYYVLDDPVITDGNYDLLIRELRELEEQYSELLTADSPTQRTGATPSAAFTPSVSATDRMVSSIVSRSVAGIRII